MGKQSKKSQSKIDVIKTVMKDVEEDVGTEEMIHLILQRQFSKNTDKKVSEELTPGQRAADAIARFAGSWTFIIIFILVLLDDDFAFQIHYVVVFGALTVLFLLTVLTHHNQRSLYGRKAGKHQIQQNKRKRVERV